MGYQSSPRFEGSVASPVSLDANSLSSQTLNMCILAFVDYMNAKQAHQDEMHDYVVGGSSFVVHVSGKATKYIPIRHGTSAYAFVDGNGDIWKPKSWRGPTLNFRRGNVFEPTSYRDFSIYGI